LILFPPFEHCLPLFLFFSIRFEQDPSPCHSSCTRSESVSFLPLLCLQSSKNRGPPPKNFLLISPMVWFPDRVVNVLPGPAWVTCKRISSSGSYHSPVISPFPFLPSSCFCLFGFLRKTCPIPCVPPFWAPPPLGVGKNSLRDPPVPPPFLEPFSIDT